MNEIDFQGNTPILKLKRRKTAIAESVEDKIVNSPTAESEAETIRTSTYSPFELSFASIRQYITDELYTADYTSSNGLKTERIRNFLSIPKELEKFMFFGLLICFDSLLYTFTILPARFVIALYAYFRSFSNQKITVKSAHTCDILKMSLLIISTWLLMFVDASQIYHAIRGQAVIKLYVIFNVLDVLNRLGSAFGHDILDSLFSANDSTPISLRKSTRYFIALFYVTIHSMMLFCQMIALNVAINSYSNSLLPIMLSSNFVELKGSVFKKSDVKNLFIISCGERFQLFSFLLMITIRNYLEMTGGGVDEIISYLFDVSVTILGTNKPFDFNVSFFSMYFTEMFSDIRNLIFVWLQSSNYKLFITLFTPFIYVYGSEIFVDSLKHAFITKFNEIPATLYSSFTQSLLRDLLGYKLPKDQQPQWEINLNNEDYIPIQPQKNGLVDRSPIVSRRIGFAGIPLACLIARVVIQTIYMLGFFEFTSNHGIWKYVFDKVFFIPFAVTNENITILQWISILIIAVAVYIWLYMVKIISGIFLLYAAQKALIVNKENIEILKNIHK